MIFGVSAASFFRLVYGVDVGLFLCVFRLRAKTADMRKLQYLPHENVFFGIRPNAYLVAFWIGFGIDFGSILACFLLKKRQ